MHNNILPKRMADESNDEQGGTVDIAYVSDENSPVAGADQLTVKGYMLESFCYAKKIVASMEFISEYDPLVFELFETVRAVQALRPVISSYDEDETDRDYPALQKAARSIYEAIESTQKFYDDNLKSKTPSQNKYTVGKENGVRAVHDHFRRVTAKYGKDVAVRIEKREEIHTLTSQMKDGIEGVCKGLLVKKQPEAVKKDGRNLIFDRVASTDNGNAARKFWEETAGEAMFVALDDFMIKLAANYRFEAEHLDRVRLLLDWSGDNMVSAREFEMMLSYFGPFREMGEKLVDAITQPYFYGYLSHQEAEELFDTPIPGMIGISSGQPEMFRTLPNSFLVRMSMNHPGTLYLHYLSSRSVKHQSKKVPIKLCDKGYYAIFPESKEEDDNPYMQTKKCNDIKYFKNISELIQSIKKARHPVLARGKNVMENKYQYSDKYAAV